MPKKFVIEIDASQVDTNEIAGEFISRMVDQYIRLWFQGAGASWNESTNDANREVIHELVNCREAAFAAAKVFDNTIGTDYKSLIEAKISEVTGEQFG